MFPDKTSRKAMHKWLLAASQDQQFGCWEDVTFVQPCFSVPLILRL